MIHLLLPVRWTQCLADSNCNVPVSRGGGSHLDVLKKDVGWLAYVTCVGLLKCLDLSGVIAYLNTLVARLCKGVILGDLLIHEHRPRREANLEPGVLLQQQTKNVALCIRDHWTVSKQISWNPKQIAP